MQPEPIQDFIRKFLADNMFRTRADDEVWAAVRDTDRSDPAFRQALAVLLERCGGDVYAVCRSRLGRHPDADDAFQDAFLALLQRRPFRASLDDARRWLCRVGGNKAVDRLRRRSAAGPLAPDLPAPAGTDPDPLGRLDAVLAAVAGLPEKYRLPFRLRHIDGLTAEQVAGRLGLTVRTVQKRVERARAKVLATLTRQGVPTTAAAALVQTTLPDAGRAATLSPERAAALAESILARAATLPASGVGLVKALVVGGALLAGGGLGWAALTGPDPEPQAKPDPPPAVAAAPAAMTYQAELVRKFEAGVEDRLRAALGKLLLGDGGEVVVTDKWAQGPRLFVPVEVRHGRPFEFVVTRLIVVQDTASGETLIPHDMYGNGDWRYYLPRYYKPPLLLQSVLGGLETRIAETMAAVTAVMKELGTDPRAAAEQARFLTAYRVAIKPMLGKWERSEAPGVPIVLEWREDDPRPLWGVHQDGGSGQGWDTARFDRAGRPSLSVGYGMGSVSATPTQIDFLNPDGGLRARWTRPPGWKP